jgi:hypothetical protein
MAALCSTLATSVRLRSTETRRASAARDIAGDMVGCLS